MVWLLIVGSLTLQGEYFSRAECVAAGQVIAAFTGKPVACRLAQDI